MEDQSVVVVKAKPVRKVFKATKQTRVPEHILNNEKLNRCIENLPKNYNFEIHKTIWRISELKAKLVALQMPEGLLLFSTTIADIIKEFTGADCLIMGDVTYGACCIDDLTAIALGAELLVHYGHSCLIPIDQTNNIKVLYVFVDIQIDPLHLIETIKLNFPERNIKLGFISTIQFTTTLQTISKKLKDDGYENITIPQYRPLSPGEILGCTAPILRCVDTVVYLGDGRFHLEAIMIANPDIKAYRYDPYEKKFTREYYDNQTMEDIRKTSIEQARNANVFGIVMGTLGRQGNPKVVAYLYECLKQAGKTPVILLLSEIFPQKIELFAKIDAFVQVACPRLSIDWGKAFNKPILTPYELAVCIGVTEWKQNGKYPMDFYANASLGPWTPNYKPDTDGINKCCGKCT